MFRAAGRWATAAPPSLVRSRGGYDASGRSWEPGRRLLADPGADPGLARALSELNGATVVALNQHDQKELPCDPARPPQALQPHRP